MFLQVLKSIIKVKYLLIILLFMVGHSLNAQTYTDTTKMNVVEGSRFIYRTAQEFIDLSDITQMSDTADVLATKNDLTLGISGTVYSRADASAIQSSTEFELGDFVKNESTGATYQIQSDSVTGYVNDNLFVISLSNGTYAKIIPKRGNLEFSDVQKQTGQDDTEEFRKALTYASLESGVNAVFISKDVWLTDTIIKPAGISIIGTYNNDRPRTLNGKIPTVYINLNDITKTAITFEDHVFAAANNYHPGGDIRRLNFEATSPAHAIINMIRPGWVVIEDIRIGSGPTQPNDFSTRYIEYGIKYGGSIKTKFQNIEIRNATRYGIWNYLDPNWGSGTTYGDNIRINNCANGFLLENGSLYISNTITESIDSSAYVLKTYELTLNGAHFENVPSSAIEVPAIKIVNGNLNINNSKLGSSFTPIHINFVAIEADTSDFIRISNSVFRNTAQSLSTTGQTKNIYFENVREVGRKVIDFEGIIDSSELTIINSDVNFADEAPTNWIPDIQTTRHRTEKSNIEDLDVFDSLEIYADTVLLAGPHNLLRYSEQINVQPPWVLPGTPDQVVITVDDTIAPDLTTTAEQIRHSLDDGGFRVDEVSKYFEEGEYFNVSFWAKTAKGATGMNINSEVIFTSNENNVDIFTITPTADWIRYDQDFYINTNDIAVALQFNIDADSIYFWGAQLTKGKGLKPYIKTEIDLTEVTKVVFEESADFTGNLQSSQLGQGAAEAADLGLILSGYVGGLTTEGIIVDMSYSDLADSLSSLISNIYTANSSLTASRVVTMDNFNLQFDPDGGSGSVTIGIDFDYGLARLEVNGGIYSVGGNFISANGFGLFGRNSASDSRNLISMDGSDQINIGSSSGGVNDVIINTGSATTDDIIFNTFSSPDSKFQGNGEWLLGTLTDQGAYNLQVEGDTYLDDQVIANKEPIIYTIDDVADLTNGTYQLGDIIKHRTNGAEYLVQATEPAHYSADGVAVIDLTGSYAVLQPIAGQYDVKWFGAVPDDSNSDTSSFRRALEFGDQILIEGGEYNVKNVNIASANVVDVREGASVEGISSSDTLFNFDGSVFDVHFKGKGLMQNANIAFKHSGGSVVSGSIFEELNFSNLQKAFDFDGSVGVDFKGMKFQTNIDSCIVFQDIQATNFNRIIDNKFLLFDSVAIHFLNGGGTSAGNLIKGNWIEDGGSGIRVRNDHSGLVIDDNYFENVGGALYPDITIWPSTAVRGLSFSNNRFSTGSVNQSYRVLLDNIINAIFNEGSVFLESGDVFAEILAAGSTASGIQFNYVHLNATGGGTYESRLYNAVSTIDVSYKLIPNSGFVTGDNLSKEFHYGDIEVGSELRSGGITDQGAYNLQVEGDTYLDDQLVINNTPQEDSDSILVSGTGKVVSAMHSADLNTSKELQIEMFAANVAVATGDGNIAVSIPSNMDDYELTNVVATVHDKGITGTTDVTIERWRAGAAVDMLSTAITIGDEWFAQDGVIDAANDDINTGDRIYVNVDAIHSGTAPNGLSIVLEFRKP